MARARALMFAAYEDFGIVPVEAQAVGLPIVGIAHGGLLDSVIDGTTGVLVDSRDPNDFVAALAIADQLKRRPFANTPNSSPPRPSEQSFAIGYWPRNPRESPHRDGGVGRRHHAIRRRLIRHWPSDDDLYVVTADDHMARELDAYATFVTVREKPPVINLADRHAYRATDAPALARRCPLGVTEPRQPVPRIPRVVVLHDLSSPSFRTK